MSLPPPMLVKIYCCFHPHLLSQTYAQRVGKRFFCVRCKKPVKNISW